MTVRNSHVALYLGCAALVVGGLGLAARSALAPEWPSSELAAPPLYMHAAMVPVVQDNWRPDNGTGAVAFHAEMIELLTPKAPIMAMHQEEPAPPAANRKKRETGREVVKATVKAKETANARETVREAAKDAKPKTASRKKREQPKAEEPAEQTEVVVHDRFGNRLRVQQVERERGSQRVERDGGSQRVERAFERAPEERGFGGPLPLFGQFAR